MKKYESAGEGSEGLVIETDSLANTSRVIARCPSMRTARSIALAMTEAEAADARADKVEADAGYERRTRPAPSTPPAVNDQLDAGR